MVDRTWRLRPIKRGAGPLTGGTAFADLVALARELLYNPNWPLDAAQKLGADPDFTLVPPQGGWWLERRAKTAKDVKPSTFEGAAAS